jgi:hypothetical protein
MKQSPMAMMSPGHQTISRTDVFSHMEVANGCVWLKPSGNCIESPLAKD